VKKRPPWKISGDPIRKLPAGMRMKRMPMLLTQARPDEQRRR